MTWAAAAAQAPQRDDTQNPAMLAVRDGEAAWTRPDGEARRACADCHGEAPTSMRGVAPRYPAFDAARGGPVTLGQRIDQCRVSQQRAAPRSTDGAAALALDAWVAMASRGLPIAPDDDRRLAPFRERGRRLGGSPIPQAHPTGYPLYRLEWQSLGSLQRRLPACLTGVRAEPCGAGSRELVELERRRMKRARGLPRETPAVRP